MFFNVLLSRRGLRHCFVLATLMVLSACQSTLDSESLLRANIRSAYQEAGLDDRRAAEILLARFTFGARPGDIDAVQQLGVDRWFATQLIGELPEAELQNHLAALDAAQYSDADLMAQYAGFSQLSAHMRRFYPGLLPSRDETSVDFQVIAAAVKNFSEEQGRANLDSDYLPQQRAQKLFHALYARNQLREVMTSFWQNHFYVSGESFAAKPWHWSLERDVLRLHALGGFSDLLVGANQHLCKARATSRRCLPRCYAALNSGDAPLSHA